MFEFYFKFFVVGNVFFILLLAVLSHLPMLGSLRIATGWWAGVIIFVLTVLAIQPYLAALPEYVYPVGCDSYKTATDWDKIYSESFNDINWSAFIIAFISLYLLIEILLKINHVPEKWLAFAVCTLVISSLWMVTIVFFFRKYGNIVFSLSFGGLTSILVYVAFLGDGEKIEKAKLRLLKTIKTDK